MNATSRSEAHSLELSHTFDAPRDEVFAAWTEPHHLVQWFGSLGSKTLDAEVDLRVGCNYRLNMRLANGQEITLGGTFREVRIPEKLVYTWEFNEPGLGDVRESLVTVEFRERGQWTDLTLRHEALPTKEVCDRHEQGWKGCFESLDAHMKRD